MEYHHPYTPARLLQTNSICATLMVKICWILTQVPVHSLHLVYNPLCPLLRPTVLIVIHAFKICLQVQRLIIGCLLRLLQYYHSYCGGNNQMMDILNLPWIWTIYLSL